MIVLKSARRLAKCGGFNGRRGGLNYPAGMHETLRFNVFSAFLAIRGDRIRTCDFLLPKHQAPRTITHYGTENDDSEKLIVLNPARWRRFRGRNIMGN